MSPGLHIATVVGARPQFIKAAVVSRALREAGLRETLIHTGQHYDDAMSRRFFDELDIPAPDCNLDVGSLPHGAQTGRMLEGIEAVLRETKPDWTLVYGDTNSTLAGALAAAKLHIPVAHVEAGLRSFNRDMPEEINRVLTDHLADLLFAPTETAVRNLGDEGLPETRIRLVGDVMYDVALAYGARAEEKSRILEHWNLPADGYVLATVHRASNTDDERCLRAIFGALARVARRLPVAVPLHPRTRAALDRAGIVPDTEALQLREAVGYLDMVRLERGARVIVTDSGGVQKEAFFHGVPCVTVREETEWVELVEMGWNELAPPSDADRIEAVILRALEGSGPDRESGASPYGEGDASARIRDALLGKC